MTDLVHRVDSKRQRHTKHISLILPQPKQPPAPNTNIETELSTMSKDKQQQSEEIGEQPDTHDDDSSSSSSTNNDTSSSAMDLQDIMESMVRITLAGCGGSIVGLSLEKRLENMRVNTTAGLSAAARRRRSPTAAVNLPVTWGVSCMVFCSIIEVARLTSPSTMVLTQLGWYEAVAGKSALPGADTASNKRHPAPITVADYTIGGLFAGLAGSFGRQFQMQKSMARIHHAPGRFFGVGPGLALGLFAGCVQAATDYGMAIAEQAQEQSAQSS